MTIDYTMIYILAFTILAIFLAFGITYLKKNNKIDNSTLEIVASTLNLSVSIISQLNLQNEEKIILIGNNVIDSINYAKNILKADTTEDLVNISIAYACKLSEDQGVELNNDRITIIENLVKLSVNNVSNINNITK